jgi:hypothetical protein
MPASTQQTSPPPDQSAPKPIERGVTAPPQTESPASTTTTDQTEPQKDLLKSISKLKRTVKSVSKKRTLKSVKKNLKTP